MLCDINADVQYFCLVREDPAEALLDFYKHKSCTRLVNEVLFLISTCWHHSVMSSKGLFTWSRGNSLTRGQLCLGARSDACNCSHELFVAPGQLREAGYPLYNTGCRGNFSPSEENVKVAPGQEQSCASSLLMLGINFPIKSSRKHQK